MGRVCAVPKCKSGYKSVKEKYSVFAAPKNAEQFKKWQAAIPGIVLKQTQCVCEKHFEPKFVLKEWIRHDSEGRVMARVPYLHRRLAEFAVPTIFDNSSPSAPPVPSVSDKPKDSVIDGSHSPEDKCESLKDTPDAECADVSCAIAVPTNSDSSTPPAPSVLDKPTDGVFDGSNTPEGQCETLEEPQMNTPDAECLDESSAIPGPLHETIQHEVLALTCPNQEEVYSASSVCRKNFLLSKITINDSTSNKNAITIPSSWGVTEYIEKKGQRIVFSNILPTNKGGMIISKSVEVKADKTLFYCVYGRFIDPERFQLPPVLTDTTLLPETLNTFKRMNVCQGLDKVNSHYLSIDCVFQDSVQRWRDNNCTILAKQKRCIHCKKMRHRILQRESRSHQSESIRRVRLLSNPIDRRKLDVLREKISQEKRANNYLRQRVQTLTKALKGKAKEISSMRAKVLDNKTVIIYV